MTCYNRVSSLRRVVRSFSTGTQPKSKLETSLRPPRANQTLKRYLESNSIAGTIQFFRELWRKNRCAVDSYSLLFALKACTLESSIVEGQQLHAIVKKLGFEPIIFLQTCLINLYSRMGNVDCARCIFDEIDRRNTICWTSVISAYADNDMPSKALYMFRQMLMDNLKPDQVTLTVTLTACADLGALSVGKWIHSYSYRRDALRSDLRMHNAFINMYAKCGEVRAAQRLFYSSRQKDVFTWTSMIVGYALHGYYHEALDLFSEMKQANRNVKGNKSLVIPNDITFLGVLMACSHAGLVEEGKKLYKSMVHDYGLCPRLPHLGCMVDLLCRAGFLEEAYCFISGMLPRPNAVMWRTLLGACSVHDKLELGAKVREQLHLLEPTHVGDDVALSNMYAAKGLWCDKMMVRDHIVDRRTPGYSSVDMEMKVNEFVAGDSHHPLKSGDL